VAASRDAEPQELARVSARLETRCYGRSLEVRASTASTNDDAREAAAAGAPRGHVVVADAQSAGRGARGRAWVSPPGTDLYLSIVERPDLSPRALAAITLAVGLGVRDACAALLETRGVGARVDVKWPNDVRIEGLKCAGVLVESSSVGDALGPVILGIGLDVNRTSWPEELRGVATSLATYAGPLERDLVLATLLRCVEARVDALLRDGAPATIQALRPHLAMVGEAVEIDGVPGRLEGIDDDGALRVRRDGRTVRVTSGTLREPGAALGLRG
jgi:BirA family biotin operon repressor/biotin-[acetyl-CoA-carboxylase] ligase